MNGFRFTATHVSQLETSKESQTAIPSASRDAKVHNIQFLVLHGKSRHKSMSTYIYIYIYM